MMLIYVSGSVTIVNNIKAVYEPSSKSRVCLYCNVYEVV